MRFRIYFVLLLLSVLASAQNPPNVGPITTTYQDTIGTTTPPPNPSSGRCRRYFNLTSGVETWINSLGGPCGPSGSGGQTPFFLATAYGVKGDGVTDDTTAMQNTLNAACPAGTHFGGSVMLGPAPFIVKITSTLTISKCQGITVDCPASQGQATPAIAGNCGFYWAGSSGGTMLSVNQTRDSEFKNFFLDCANTCNIPFLIDESGTVTTVTTNDHIQDVAIRNDTANANFVGFDICPSAPGNCEAINFDRVWVNCSGGSPTATSSGTGLQYVAGEPFYEYVHGLFTSGCSIGGAVYAGNIMDFDGGLANEDYTDFLVDGGRNVYYRHFRSENGTAQIVLGNGSSFPGNDALIEENSFSGLTNNTTTISYGGSNTGGYIRIIRNEWDQNSTITPFGPTGSGAFVGHLYTEFNNFPNTTNCPPVTGANHVAEYVSILNLSFGTPACPGGLALGGYFTSPQFISTTLTGTPPLSVVSTTQVSNLNVSALEGDTWEIPGTIGSTTPNSANFITPTAGDNSTKAATTAFVAQAITNAPAVSGEQIINVNTTPVTVNANTTAPQAMMTYSVPAGKINTSTKTIRITAWGLWSVAASPIIALSAYLNGVQLGIGGTISTGPAASGGNGVWNFQTICTVTTTGTSGILKCGGMGLGSNLSMGSNNQAFANVGTTTAIDLTVAETLSIQGSFSLGSTSNSFTENELIVETLN